MKARFLYFAALVLLTSCGPSTKEYRELQAENENLTKQNEFLAGQVENYKAELGKYQLSPSVLYAKAEEHIKAKDRNALNNVLQQLKKYHPSSNEYKRVDSALAALDKEIAKEKAAEEARQAAEKAKRMQAVKKLKSKYDDVSGTTWYYNPYFTHYTNSNHVSVYMGKKKDGSPWLRLFMSYYGDDWIFFEKAYLSFDENTLEIPFDKYKDKETDNGGGSVWEWIDISVTRDIRQYLEQLSKGKTAKVRFTGKYSQTRTLTTSEVNGIKDVLLAYDVLVNEE